MKNNKNKIKYIIKKIKKDDFYIQYKNKFKNSQTKFWFTSIYFIFNENLKKEDEEKIILNEKALLKANNEIEFGNIFSKLNGLLNTPFNLIDWFSFGCFYYYSYQLSLFFIKKLKQKSIYNEKNFNEINKIKIVYYNKWITSFYDLKFIEMNKYIIKVLKLFK